MGSHVPKKGDFWKPIAASSLHISSLTKIRKDGLLNSYLDFQVARRCAARMARLDVWGVGGGLAQMGTMTGSTNIKEEKTAGYSMHARALECFNILLILMMCKRLTLCIRPMNGRYRRGCDDHIHWFVVYLQLRRSAFGGGLKEMHPILE